MMDYRKKTQVFKNFSRFSPGNLVSGKNQRRGFECENLALKHFQNKKFHLVARNLKISGVEVDLLFRKKKLSFFFQKFILWNFADKRLSEREVLVAPGDKKMDHQNQWLIVEVKSLRRKDEISFRLNFKQQQRLQRAKEIFENKVSSSVELRVVYVLPSGDIIDLSLEDHL